MVVTLGIGGRTEGMVVTLGIGRRTEGMHSDPLCRLKMPWNGAVCWWLAPKECTSARYSTKLA